MRGCARGRWAGGSAARSCDRRYGAGLGWGSGSGWGWGWGLGLRLGPDPDPDPDPDPNPAGKGAESEPSSRQQPRWGCWGVWRCLEMSSEGLLSVCGDHCLSVRAFALLRCSRFQPVPAQEVLLVWDYGEGVFVSSWNTWCRAGGGIWLQLLASSMNIPLLQGAGFPVQPRGTAGGRGGFLLPMKLNPSLSPLAPNGSRRTGSSSWSASGRWGGIEMLPWMRWEWINAMTPVHHRR